MTQIKEREKTEKDVQKKKGLRHFLHPTEPNKAWCGTPLENANPAIAKLRLGKLKVNCVVCIDLWNHHGTLGWLRLAGRKI